ncbi:4-alpha-glucanotransferase [Hydrotalea sp.]|uniref:4-alpha-glucanotransferase n=3 Tax=Hydrotalea sp. TaxID=2881279 RepID=UPI002628B993|nr:4-alpha-glucanotransferase [Hydrotalea sp.]
MAKKLTIKPLGTNKSTEKTIPKSSEKKIQSDATLPVESATGKNQKENKVVKKKTTPKESKSAKKTTDTTKKETASVKKKATTTKKVMTADSVKPTSITTFTIAFYLKFSTHFGQNLFITGNHPKLGNQNIEQAVPLQYFNANYWKVTIPFEGNEIPKEGFTYHYILKNEDGTIGYDWGNDKKIVPAFLKKTNLIIEDAWNFAGYYENAFYTEPFQQILLPKNEVVNNATKLNATTTHFIRVKAPLLQADEVICLCGESALLNHWSTEKPLLLKREKEDAVYSVQLKMPANQTALPYKFGVYNTKLKQFIRFENGNNRILKPLDTTANALTIINAGFAVLPNNNWRGTGVAIPVFSLRSEQSFGVGEFTDLKLLVNWAKRTGLKLVQILPVNDTTATHTWTDSYPYAAISAFALHPLYLNLKNATLTENVHLLDNIEAQRLQLNALETVDYETVMQLKQSYLQQLYPLQQATLFQSAEFQSFFQNNQHWLIPYAVFCYLRDVYETANFSEWAENSIYKEATIIAMASPDAPQYHAIAYHYFVQFYLHLQLQEATVYAHQNGIILKGDIAIGVYRNGADAWQAPHLFHLNMQAGAPPDDFAIKGQNWGFPTYNWQQMMQDGFAWWKMRFEQMRYYFDAFRIDHILGFFRIWSIPLDAVEGIMGRFVPALPVHINELYSRNIWFDYHRFTKPYINDDVLNEIFGNDADFVRNTFLQYNGFGTYTLKEECNTQHKVDQYLAHWNNDVFTQKMKQGLFDLISNVIFFEEDGSHAQQFHFRFAMEKTISFRHLDAHTQQQLRELYVDYYFRRQDDFWMKEALQKLPALKRVTNMLICGEDLGLVPACVPEVMRQLGLLSLEIQRMPKNLQQTFFHPNDAPYLSVVTPSTHDMSTIRGWWEEDKQKTQQFYNNELGQWGTAPFYCEAWINKAIVVQHLYSPAMWSIFQLQDLLGMDENIRRNNPNDERINIPSNPKHYWRYRMHLSLEQLLEANTFNEAIQQMVQESGR